jgi:hypothetical protein
LSAAVSEVRRPVAADNPLLALQERVSAHITQALDTWRDARDGMEERVFFSFYGSPFVQAMLGITKDSVVRPMPETTPGQLAARRTRTKAYAAMLETGGFDEALTRAALYVIAANRTLDQRCAFALNAARKQFMHLSLAAFKILVRDQFFVLQLEPDRAIAVLPSLVPAADARTGLLRQVRAIASAGDPMTAAEEDRLALLSRVLVEPEQRPTAAAKAHATATPDVVLY